MTPKHYVHFTESDIPHATATDPIPNAGTPFMQPGNYVVDGQGYDCTAPGLYRWLIPSEALIVSRIVYGGDLYAFMSAISWHHVHGLEHDGISNALWLGRFQKWRMTCGFISNLVRNALNDMGIVCRRVGIITNGEQNGMDDGHFVVETQHGDEWRMWDMTHGRYFTVEGRHIDTQEFVDILASGGFPDTVRLDATDKHNSEAHPLFCTGSYADAVYRTDDQRRDWYRRIFQRIYEMS